MHKVLACALVLSSALAVTACDSKSEQKAQDAQAHTQAAQKNTEQAQQNLQEA